MSETNAVADLVGVLAEIEKRLSLIEKDLDATRRQVEQLMSQHIAWSQQVVNKIMELALIHTGNAPHLPAYRRTTEPAFIPTIFPDSPGTPGTSDPPPVWTTSGGEVVTKDDSGTISWEDKDGAVDGWPPSGVTVLESLH